jgi:hypothetical protein
MTYLRHVILTSDVAKLVPKGRLMTEAEWREFLIILFLFIHLVSLTSTNDCVCSVGKHFFVKSFFDFEFASFVFDAFMLLHSSMMLIFI